MAAARAKGEQIEPLRLDLPQNNEHWLRRHQ